MKVINTETTMKRILISLFTLLLATPAFAQTEGARLRKIDSLLSYLYENNKFMGSVAIRDQGEIVFEKAYGFADVEAKIPATEDTKYKIGSITKMFTSAIIFQLIEEKQLKLDTKLSEFFPKIKNADKITISDMLNHTSGIFNYTADPWFTQNLSKLVNRRDIVQKLESFPLAFQPGERAEYSNTNYLLLGYIIQDITHKSYKENVTSRIINRIGLKDTYYYSKINPKKKEAYSYSFENGKWIKYTPEWHESVTGAAGGLQSTPQDLTLFITALFDGTIIKPESLQQMTEMKFGYGRGILAFPFGQRNFLGHNGNIESFNSVLGYYPKDDLAISLLINGDNYNYNDIVLGILSIYYKLPYIFPNLASVALDESTLKRHEGIYSNPALPFKVDIRLVDGVLVAHATDQGSFPLNPLSENVFNFDPAGITITFTATGFTLRQADGSTSEFKRE